MFNIGVRGGGLCKTKLESRIYTREDRHILPGNNKKKTFWQWINKVNRQTIDLEENVHNVQERQVIKNKNKQKVFINGPETHNRKIGKSCWKATHKRAFVNGQRV